MLARGIAREHVDSSRHIRDALRRLSNAMTVAQAGRHEDKSPCMSSCRVVQDTRTGIYETFKKAGIITIINTTCLISTTSATKIATMSFPKLNHLQQDQDVPFAGNTSGAAPHHCLALEQQGYTNLLPSPMDLDHNAPNAHPVNDSQNFNNMAQQYTHPGPETELPIPSVNTMHLTQCDGKHQTPCHPVPPDNPDIFNDIPNQIQLLIVAWFVEVGDQLMQLRNQVAQWRDSEPEESVSRHHASETWKSLDTAHENLLAWHNSRLAICEFNDPATGTVGQCPSPSITPGNTYGGQQSLDPAEDDFPHNYCHFHNKCYTKIDRHKREVHPGPDTTFYCCGERNCNHETTRLGNFKRHAETHGHNSTPVVRMGL